MQKVVMFLVLAVLLLFLFDYVAEQSSEDVVLVELQVLACEAADEAGTCSSRLPEVGIVLQEECCQALGKCCQN